MRYLLALALLTFLAGCSGGGRTPGYTTASSSASVMSSRVYDKQGNEVDGATLVKVRGALVTGQPRVEYTVYHQSTGKALNDWRIHFSSPEFELLSGWAYFIGRCPVAVTKRVRAVGTGTRMVVEIDSDTDNMHRVYLLYHEEAPTATVGVYLSGTLATTLTTPRTFCEVDAYGKLAGPFDLDALDSTGAPLYRDQRNFIADVEASTGDTG